MEELDVSGLTVEEIASLPNINTNAAGMDGVITSDEVAVSAQDTAEDIASGGAPTPADGLARLSKFKLEQMSHVKCANPVGEAIADNMEFEAEERAAAAPATGLYGYVDYGPGCPDDYGVMASPITPAEEKSTEVAQEL